MRANNLRAIRPGSLVEHTRHGTGVVLQRWGGWREMLPDRQTIEINGELIYDVRFPNGIQSIHRSRLKEVPVLRAKRVLARL